jgi:hypothetical protein
MAECQLCTDSISRSINRQNAQKLYGTYNDIVVPSFILSGAPFAVFIPKSGMKVRLGSEQPFLATPSPSEKRVGT